MGLQKFYASPTDTFTYANDAVGHRPGGSFDCLGPFAKVTNCPIEGTDLRRTCYARDYSDMWFSVPAHCKVRGKTITGYFTVEEDACVFRPYDKHKEFLGIATCAGDTANEDA